MGNRGDPGGGQMFRKRSPRRSRQTSCRSL